MSAPRKADWPVVAGVVLGILLALLVMYVWGYYALGRLTQDNVGDRVRVYQQNWQVVIFRPAARVEKWLISDDVWLRGPD